MLDGLKVAVGAGVRLLVIKIVLVLHQKWAWQKMADTVETGGQPQNQQKAKRQHVVHPYLSWKGSTLISLQKYAPKQSHNVSQYYT